MTASGQPAWPGQQARDQIDALRAVADLLLLHPAPGAWISVTSASIQVFPGTASDVTALARLLGVTARTTSHQGQAVHSASGRLGRHQIYLFATLTGEEAS
jgi:hypothetical protein